MNQLNVRQFGATGDGITDDTESIQKALDSGSSRTVFIPEGVYRITSTLQVSSDTSIVADSSIP
ncbi:MAG: glycosyl hydrolase family 28-related protein [Eubacteriales bacterium]